MNRGLYSNFWWLRSANCVSFIEWYVMSRELKIPINELSMSLPLRIWMTKTVYWVETHWISGNEKVPGVADRKEELAYRTRRDTLLSISMKRFICRQLFQLPNLLAKFTFIKWPYLSIYLSIYHIDFYWMILVYLSINYKDSHNVFYIIVYKEVEHNH